LFIVLIKQIVMEQRDLFMGIDIGIKNLAVCIIDKNKWVDYTENGKDSSGILYWKIINLSTKTEKCNGVFKSGKSCNVNAKYKVEDKYYCKRHATHYNHILLCDNVKKTSTNDILIKSFQKLLLEEEFYTTPLKGLAIELQPTFNSKMKNLSIGIQSFLLCQWLRLNIPLPETIRFSHAKNKWRVIQYYNYPIPDIKKNYKKGKQVAVDFTSFFLKKDDIYYTFFNKNVKKDDLADSFLHAVWLIQR